MECRHCSSSQSIKLASKIFCANCGLPKIEEMPSANTTVAAAPINTPINTSNTSPPNTNTTTANITAQQPMGGAVADAVPSPVSTTTDSNISAPIPAAIAPVESSSTVNAAKQQAPETSMASINTQDDSSKTGGILSKIFRKKKSNGITPEAIDAVFASIDQHKDINQVAIDGVADSAPIISPITNIPTVEQNNGLGLNGTATATIADQSFSDDSLSLSMHQEPINAPSVINSTPSQQQAPPSMNQEPNNAKPQNKVVPDNNATLSLDISPPKGPNTDMLLTDTKPTQATNSTQNLSQTDNLKDLVNTISRIDDISPNPPAIDLRPTNTAITTDNLMPNTSKNIIPDNDNEPTGKEAKTDEPNPLDLSNIGIEEIPNTSNDLSAKNILSSFKPANVALSIIGIIILGIYIWQVNYSSIALRFAASKSGLSANVPGYIPTGWQLSNKFQAEPGRLTFSLVSPDSKSNIAINQVKSNWNTQDLLENFVLAKSDSYLALQSQGTTIYIYGKSQASWVEDGKWYRIEGDNNLSHEDLVKLASSI